MKTNGKHKVIAQIAGPGLVLAALFVLALSNPGIGRAQSSTTSSAAPAAKPAAAPAKLPALPAVKPPAKGQHEGITVHGHWVIEVRNPDGKLVKHVEFENSLDPGFTMPVSAPLGPRSIQGGADLLSTMFISGYQPDPTAWGIMLVGPAGLANLSNTANAPCVVTLAADSRGSNTGPIDACILLPLAPNPNVADSDIVTQNPCTTNPPGPPGISCSVVSVPITGASGTALSGFQISGSVTASQQQGLIQTVATQNYEPCGAEDIRPGQCAFGPLGMVSFTSTSSFPGAPISVTSGQTVAVNVAISFQ